MSRGRFPHRSGESSSFDAFVSAGHDANTYNKVANDTAVVGTVDLINVNITMPTGGGTLWIVGTSSGELAFGGGSTVKIVLVVDGGEIIGASCQNPLGAATFRASMAVNLAMALSAGVHPIKLRCVAPVGYTIAAATSPTFDHAALYTELRP